MWRPPGRASIGSSASSPYKEHSGRRRLLALLPRPTKRLRTLCNQGRAERCARHRTLPSLSAVVVNRSISHITFRGVQVTPPFSPLLDHFVDLHRTYCSNISANGRTRGCAFCPPVARHPFALSRHASSTIAFRPPRRTRLVPPLQSWTLRVGCCACPTRPTARRL